MKGISSMRLKLHKNSLRSKDTNVHPKAQWSQVPLPKKKNLKKKFTYKVGQIGFLNCW